MYIEAAARRRAPLLSRCSSHKLIELLLAVAFALASAFPYPTTHPRVANSRPGPALSNPARARSNHTLAATKPAAPRDKCSTPPAAAYRCPPAKQPRETRRPPRPRAAPNKIRARKSFSATPGKGEVIRHRTNSTSTCVACPAAPRDFSAPALAPGIACARTDIPASFAFTTIRSATLCSSGSAESYPNTKALDGAICFQSSFACSRSAGDRRGSRKQKCRPARPLRQQPARSLPSLLQNKIHNRHAVNRKRKRLPSGLSGRLTRRPCARLGCRIRACIRRRRKPAPAIHPAAKR